MFDPHHNAVKGYYHVKGDLSGAWSGLPEQVVIFNWNNKKQSFQFFADQGYKQIVTGNANQLAEDLELINGIDGVIGMAYVSWTSDYSGLEAWADAFYQTFAPNAP
jgi:hypothetical protein